MIFHQYSTCYMHRLRMICVTVNSFNLHLHVIYYHKNEISLYLMKTRGYQRQYQNCMSIDSLW